MSTSDACFYQVKRTCAVGHILNGAAELRAAGKECPSDV
jgi:hypothetical protein